MTSPKTESWWARFCERLRGRPAARRPIDDLPEVGEDGLLAEGPEYLDGDGTGERPAAALSRWSRRDQTLARLQEGYEKVTQVIDTMQKHLAEQGERTERIASSLEQLARAVADLPTSSRQQLEALEGIAGQLETANVRSHHLSEALSELPKLTRLQAETLSGMKRQLEMATEHSAIGTQTMEKLGTTLGEISTAQTRALQEINERTAEQNHHLARLIADQGRRFVWLFVVTIILAVGAIAAAILSLTLR